MGNFSSGSSEQAIIPPCTWSVDDTYATCQTGGNAGAAYNWVAGACQWVTQNLDRASCAHHSADACAADVDDGFGGACRWLGGAMEGRPAAELDVAIAGQQEAFTLLLHCGHSSGEDRCRADNFHGCYVDEYAWTIAAQFTQEGAPKNPRRRPITSERLIPATAKSRVVKTALETF